MLQKGDKEGHFWEKVFKNDLQGMLLPIVLMALIGSINIFSATYIGSITTDDGLWGYAPKHLLFLLVSAILGVFLYRFDYRRLQNVKLLTWVMGLTAVTLIAIYLVGVEVNGARRWIPLGPFSLQPSEFAKLAALLWTAAKLADKPWTKPRFKSMFKPKKGMDQKEVALGYIFERVKYMGYMLLWPIVFAVLTIKQPDMGTAVLIIGFSYLLIFLSGFEKSVFGLSLVAAVLAGIYAARSSSYRWERVVSWFDPWSYAQDKGYQTVQGLLAVGSGGFFGQGFMNGTSKYFYLPEAHTDFAFAVWAQEMGFLGGIAVVFLMATFTFFGFRIANRARDAFGRWLAIGITILISGQAFFNIAMVCGMLPVTGVPLPFVSYGGSSLMMNCMAIGILASIARRSVEGVKPVGTKDTLPSLREETRSRFKPSKSVEPELPGRFVPPDKR